MPGPRSIHPVTGWVLNALIGALPGTPDAWTVRNAWTKIDTGVKIGNRDLVWQGNQDLAYYEQWVVLQKIYDRFPNVADGILSYLMISPLPDDFTMFKSEYCHHSFREVSFRWAFIVRRLLPYWKRLDTNGELETRIQILAMAKMPKNVVCKVL